MTADIRTAAQRESLAHRVHQDMEPGEYWGIVEGFADGAVWAQARVTPTREQIAEAVRLADGEWDFREGTDREDPRTHGAAIADAVLALMQELAEASKPG